MVTSQGVVSDGSQVGFDERLRWWTGGLLLAASLVHGGVVPAHAEEWWGYAVFFVLAALSQAMLGLAVLMAPWRYDATGGLDANGGERTAHAVYLWCVVLTAAIIALYVVTRTVGIPFFGPGAGETESLTLVSVISKAIELATIGCLVGLLRRPGGRHGGAGRADVSSWLSDGVTDCLIPSSIRPQTAR